MTATAETPSATVFELAGDLDIRMSRTFDAPRALVWRANTEAEHFARWWGPRGYTTDVREMDVRVGGRWESLQTNPAGNTYRFWGEFLEVAQPERLVFTQRFGEYPPLIVTIEFGEHEGKTTLDSTIHFDTPEARTATLKQGMEWGARESWDRLAELLAIL